MKAVPSGLAARLRGRVVIVGIGNPLRGDDAAGCLLARALSGAPGLMVVESEDVPERDVLAIADARPDVVVLADALDLGLSPGSVALVETGALAGYVPTTHRVPLAVLADVLRRASGADVLVLGFQPRQVELGAAVSDDVHLAVRALAAWIRRRVRNLAAAPEGSAPVAEAAKC